MEAGVQFPLFILYMGGLFSPSRYCHWPARRDPTDSWDTTESLRTAHVFAAASRLSAQRMLGKSLANCVNLALKCIDLPMVRNLTIGKKRTYF